jgi:hypothetical protein
MKQISPRQETSLSPPKDWPSSRPATKSFTSTWTKLWTKSTKICNGTKNWRTEFPDHPEPSERYRRWKRRLQCSNGTNQNQNTKFQNTPQVTDAGSESQVYTRSKSRSYSTMKPKRSTTKIKSWETKWRKFLNKTPTCRTKLQKSTKPLRRSSRKTQLWLWSRGRSQPICSFNTAAMVKMISKQMTSPGENHSSKRRSESQSYGHRKRLNSKSESESRDENYCQYEKQKFESESKIKNKNMKTVKVRNKEALTMIRAELTAKVNEVKAIEKTLTGPKIEGEKQLNKKIGSEPTVTLPPRFTTMFNISISIYISIIFTIFIFKNFIPISESIVSDPFDHHSQTFTTGDLSDCKTFCLPRQTASVQAETLVKTLANSDSRRPFKVPETWPELHYRNLSRNPFVPSHLPSGWVRKSETNLYHDSFILNYLESSR